MPTLLQVNPFEPARIKPSQTSINETLTEYFPAHSHVPTMVQVNGEWVLREDWDKQIIPSDEVVITTLMQGGGGDGEKNPLRTVLTLVVAVAASVIAGPAGAAIFGSAIGASAAAAVVAIGGNLLINKLVPLPTAPTAQLPDYGQPAETYSIGNNRNANKLGSPVPWQFGRIKWAPPLAAAPYVTHEDNEQFYNLILLLGHNEHDINQITLGETLLGTGPAPAGNPTGFTIEEQFSDVTVEHIRTGDHVTSLPYFNTYTSTDIQNFELQVDELDFDDLNTESYQAFSAFGLVGGNSQITLASPHNLGFDSDNSYVSIVRQNGDTVGNVQCKVIDAMTIEFTPTGLATLNAAGITGFSGTGLFGGGVQQLYCYSGKWVGPFAVTKEGVTGTELRYQIVIPRLIQYHESTGEKFNMPQSVVFEYREVGTPTWTSIAHGFTEATIDPIRRDFSAVTGAAPTRWEMRAKAMEPRVNESLQFNQIFWSTSTAILNDDYLPGGKTAPYEMLAVRIRASAQTTQFNSQSITVDSTAKMSVYDDVGGTLVENPAAPTMNPAWVAFNASKLAGLGASSHDLAEVKLLADTLDARGDTCNGVIEFGTSLYEAIKLIGTTGRFNTVWYAGRPRYIRQEPRIATYMITAGEIVADSINLKFTTPDENFPDSIAFSYWDNDRGAETTIVRGIDGNTNNPRKFTSLFTTDVAQAENECWFYNGLLNYQRIEVSFTVEREGIMLEYGQLLAFHLPIPFFGTAGQIRSISGNTIALDNDAHLAPGSNAIIRLRQPNGRIFGDFPCTVTGTDEVQLTQVPTWDIELIPTSFHLGTLAELLHMNITSAVPIGDGKTNISGILYDERAHTLETDRARVPSPLGLPG